MSNKDYTKYAKIGSEIEAPVNSIPEVAEPVVIIEDEPIDNMPTPEVEPIDDLPTIEPESEIAQYKIGLVYNCEKLNVRQKPKSSAPVICELFRNTEVEINIDGSADGFYKIRTASGIEGFCMKAYILEK